MYPIGARHPCVYIMEKKTHTQSLHAKRFQTVHVPHTAFFSNVPAPSTKKRKENVPELGENAPHGPYVRRRTVVVAAQQDLRRAVPQRHHLVGVLPKGNREHLCTRLQRNRVGRTKLRNKILGDMRKSELSQPCWVLLTLSGC